jgi:hypothetical protein
VNQEANSAHSPPPLHVLNVLVVMKRQSGTCFLLVAVQSLFQAQEAKQVFLLLTISAHLVLQQIFSFLRCTCGSDFHDLRHLLPESCKTALVSHVRSHSAR